MTKKKKIFSKKHKVWGIFVDCTECTRGCNGKSDDPCVNYKIKVPGEDGCFIGTIRRGVL